MATRYYNNVINYPYIDYIIKKYIPEMGSDPCVKKVDMSLFREAMMHESTKRRHNDKTYERLEYFGDAVFHLIVTEYFYTRYEEENEGFLTKLRIRIERGDSMAELTQLLGLVDFIQINGIPLNDHILEDVFEAFIGAFYLSFGIPYTRKLIVALIERHKNLSELIFYDDNYKDLLLRFFHQKKWGHPIYESHVTYNSRNGKEKTFTSLVVNAFDKKIGKGTANNKKKAEQLASKNALERLGVIVDGEVDTNWIDKIEKIEKQEKEQKENKTPMSIYNIENRLITKDVITTILSNYNVVLPKETPIKMKLFQEAMTHRSYLVKKKTAKTKKSASVKPEIPPKNAVLLQKKSNERLQFLGDSVIHFVIGEYLYHRYQDANEGFMTRLRCKLENRDSLFYLATQTELGAFVLVSQFIESLHGRSNVNIIGGGFEAFVGALYLNYRFSIAKQFVLEVLRLELDIAKIAKNETNYKELVLQIYNQNHWGHPVYKKIKEEGPDHNKIFTMGIYHNNKLLGTGTAHSKKKAEQIASRIMYQKWILQNKKES